MKIDSRKSVKKKKTKSTAPKQHKPLQPPATAYLNLLKRPVDASVAAKKR